MTGRSRLARAWHRLRTGHDPRVLSTDLATGLGLEDPAWAASLDQELRRPGQRLPEALRAFLEQPDSRAQLMRRLVRQRLGPEPGPLFVSLGTHCYTSTLLKQWGLRKWSGPFDWLFSSPAMVADCIADDFAILLDRSQYEPVPLELRLAGPESNRVHHRAYRERYGIQHIFNHHDVHLDHDYAHLQRAVQRFRAALTSRIPHNFLLMSWHYAGFEADVARVQEALRGRSSGFRLLAYGVREPQGPPMPSLIRVHDEDNLAIHTFDPISRWQPLFFPDFLDEHLLIQSIMTAAIGPRPANEMQAFNVGS